MSSDRSDQSGDGVEGPPRRRRGRPPTSEAKLRECEQLMAFGMRHTEVAARMAERYGLTERQIYKWIAVIQHRWREAELEERPERIRRYRRAAELLMMRSVGDNDLRGAHMFLRTLMDLDGVGGPLIQQTVNQVNVQMAGVPPERMTDAERMREIRALLSKASGQPVLEIEEGNGSNGHSNGSNGSGH